MFYLKPLISKCMIIIQVSLNNNRRELQAEQKKKYPESYKTVPRNKLKLYFSHQPFPTVGAGSSTKIFILAVDHQFRLIFTACPLGVHYSLGKREKKNSVHRK
jgi:hypothetical protein